MDWFTATYLPNHDAGLEPSASPMNAADVRALPPAMVITAEYDPLRDQGEKYARKLASAGVQVEAKRYEGMIHAFFSFAGVIDKGKVAIADAGAAMRRALGASGASSAGSV